MTANEHLGGWIPATVEHPHGDPRSYTPDLWKHLIDLFDVRSVLDVGCGPGYHMEWFYGQNLETWGIDGDTNARDQCRLVNRFLLHDFTQSSLNLEGHRAYVSRSDLVWCCETVEHIDREHLPNLLNTISRCCGKLLAMTHALPGQAGHHHVTLKNSDWWIGTIESYGFLYAHRLTMELRWIAPDNSYFHQSGLIFIPCPLPPNTSNPCSKSTDTDTDTSSDSSTSDG